MGDGKKAIAIKATGAVKDLGERRFTLKEMQGLVGGYIEIVPGPCRYKGQPCEMVVNEEGKIDGLPYNDLASAICYRRDRIVGDVFILIGGNLNDFSVAALDDD